MQENFDRYALPFTLQYEGGWSNNPKDPGGATEKGITRATLSHELGRMATLTELRNISPATVSLIYRKKYWNLINADALPAGVDVLLFDIAVNNGPGRAEEWENETRNMRPIDRINDLHALRLGFWKRLAIWSYFGRGWAARETACHALALKLAGGANG
jgi:lysozyme family protein